MLRVTLLAAGFVVGPNGSSIHQIEAITGASIYSFNRQKDWEGTGPSSFHVEGVSERRAHAVDGSATPSSATMRLAEGNHASLTVKRCHKLTA